MSISPGTIEYFLRASSNEVIALISSAIGSERRWHFTWPPWARGREMNFVGRIQGNHFRIRTSLNSDEGSLYIYLYGVIENAPHGSTLRAHFAMSPFFKAIATLWYGFLGFFVFGSLPLDPQTRDLRIAGSLIMAVFGWAIYRYRRRNDEEAIRKQLHEVLTKVAIYNRESAQSESS